MKNQDKVSPHARLSKVRGRPGCPRHRPASGRAEQQTLDTKSSGVVAKGPAGLGAIPL